MGSGASKAELDEGCKYGVWDSNQKRIITRPLDTHDEAERALAHWQFEYRADDEDPAVLSVKKIRPDDDGS